ncbi:hypothetical protein QBC40DRAFT_280694 [Triangularia verruculosa]|uniref:DUF221-domain-containing protein n=1 Tax=Triangularia verruculosa TaxID=2587418 RepID=A0AAN6XG00_9PEZI|nr:hypothetical protein QBC40DRAFT_280694 [Triangularia verruculosa]
MNTLEESKKPKCDGDEFVKPGPKDFEVQFAISLSLGLSAFLAFCILRRRWKSLYAARKRHAELDLPHLPDTFFGWMPALYRITEQQVLACAGLDAYVFLTFFKMSLKLFAAMFFFAVVVLEPINRHFVPGHRPNGTDPTESFLFREYAPYSAYQKVNLFEDDADDSDDDDPDKDKSFNKNMSYLWSYLVFIYVFTGLTLFMLNRYTLKVIRIRQNYLGTQSTITDRTFRLSGIPKDLRTESAIKTLVERLEIGKVESVTLCRDWKEIDELMERRAAILAKLEETWSVYTSQKPKFPAGTQANGDGIASGTPEVRSDEEAGESERLLRGGHDMQIDRPRPQARLWYGFLRMQSRKIDGLDYYTERLRLLDERIFAARKKTYEPANIAFVTMDSIAACQMAIQALIDPGPGQLLTKPAPAPSDVVWRNTYKPWWRRRLQSWIITVFISILSIIWLVPVAALASTTICTIKAIMPSLAETLKNHEIIRSLIQTGIPTVVVSLLNVAVPYLYDFLSEHQGMISRGDIALSVISKNFFFTFFNIFLIFTVFGAAVAGIQETLRKSLTDSTYIAYTIATKIEDLIKFYSCFIMLQGLGLFPFRLLQFGSISLYPINRMGAKTPRDFAQIMQPPMFYYGFYLPTALLIFILCLVYSVLPNGYQVLGLGVVYFVLGYFTYKYQLLYAMDQPQHATGGAWRMICYRVILGLVVFQVTMSGYLALRSAFTVALLVIPLIIGTLWYSWNFKWQFEPLTKFISLISIKRGEDEEGVDEVAILDDDREGGYEQEEDEPALRRRGSTTVDEAREKGLRFVNPNLVVPLEQPWIYQDPPPPFIEENDGLEFDVGGSEGEYPYYGAGPGPSRRGRGGETGDEAIAARPPGPGSGAASSNSSSSISLGDTHIWRQ